MRVREPSPDLDRTGGHVRHLWAHPLGPATAGWVALAVAAGAYDLWLLRRGYQPLTAAARSPWGRVVRRYVTGHFDEQLGLDLFALLGRVVTR